MKSYIPKRPIKQIQDSFTKGQMTTVDEFIKNNYKPEPTAAVTAYQTFYAQVKTGSYLAYLNDTGEGRISSGLKSLEAITKVLKGVPASAMVLFDQIIYTNPYIFRESDNDESIIEVIENLGLAQFVIPAGLVSKNVVIDINELSLRISKDVKSGVFTFNKYLNETLRKSKAVVSAAMNYKAI